MSPIRLSHRASTLAPSATAEVMAAAKSLKAQGIDVVDLGPGEPEEDTPGLIADAGIAAIQSGETRYTPVPGRPDLRQAIADHYLRARGCRFEMDQVLVAAGGKQALFNACLALFEEGDEVIVPTPAWVSYPQMVHLAGATSISAPTDPDDGFRISADLIDASWTERTKGVVLCSPANPHGRIVDRDQLEAIVELCAARDAVLLFDHCYEYFVYGREHVTAADLAVRHPDTVILFGTFSKTWAMTGWRIGWLVGPTRLVKACAGIQGHSTTNACSIAQRAALTALTEEGRATIQPMIAAFARRREVIVEELRRIPGISCELPDGAFYVFADVRSLIAEFEMTGSVQLARELLDEMHLATVPGVAFGVEGFIRLSFVASEDRVREGIHRIARFVSARRNAGSQNPAEKVV